MDLLQTESYSMGWEGAGARKEWSAVVLWLNSRCIWRGQGRKEEGCKRFLFLLPFSLPPPSPSHLAPVEAGTMAADPTESGWCSRNTGRVRKREQVLISPSSFSSLPAHWPGLREVEYSLITLLINCWKNDHLPLPLSSSYLEGDKVCVIGQV